MRTQQVSGLLTSKIYFIWCTRFLWDHFSSPFFVCATTCILSSSHSPIERTQSFVHYYCYMNSYNKYTYLYIQSIALSPHTHSHASMRSKTWHNCTLELKYWKRGTGGAGPGDNTTTNYYTVDYIQQNDTRGDDLSCVSLGRNCFRNNSFKTCTPPKSTTFLSFGM